MKTNHHRQQEGERSFDYNPKAEKEKFSDIFEFRDGDDKLLRPLAHVYEKSSDIYGRPSVAANNLPAVNERSASDNVVALQQVFKDNVTEQAPTNRDAAEFSDHEESPDASLAITARTAKEEQEIQPVIENVTIDQQQERSLAFEANAFEQEQNHQSAVEAVTVEQEQALPTAIEAVTLEQEQALPTAIEAVTLEQEQVPSTAIEATAVEPEQVLLKVIEAANVEPEQVLPIAIEAAIADQEQVLPTAIEAAIVEPEQVLPTAIEAATVEPEQVLPTVVEATAVEQQELLSPAIEAITIEDQQDSAMESITAESPSGHPAISSIMIVESEAEEFVTAKQAPSMVRSSDIEDVITTDKAQTRRLYIKHFPNDKTNNARSYNFMVGKLLKKGLKVADLAS